MCLFESISRVDSSPRRYTEGHFQFLNRSGRCEAARVRGLIEEWSSHYPSSHRNALHSRITSNDSRLFESAFFELFLHEMLLRLGCEAEIHPSPPSGTARCPDFLVRTPNAGEIYLEATTVTEVSDRGAVEEARKNVVYDIINDKLQSPDFWLLMTMRGAPHTPPPGRQIVRELSDWLSGLDWEEASGTYRSNGMLALPTYDFEHQGWQIKFTALPKSSRGRGMPGLRPIGAQLEGAVFVRTAEAIRKSVRDKASRYGALDRAFIVAVNCVSDYPDTEDVDRGLYGTTEAYLPEGPTSADGFEVRRRHDGAFTPDSNTRVSGALVCGVASPFIVAKSTATLYHNPWAQLSCADALPELSNAFYRSETCIERHRGQLLRDVLGLPEDWPRSSSS